MSWYHFSLWVQYCCHPKSAALVCNMQILAKDILLQCSKKLHFLGQFMWLLRWPSILVTIYVLSSFYLQNGVIVYGSLSDIMVARCHFAGPIGATIKHQSPGQVLALWIYIDIYKVINHWYRFFFRILQYKTNYVYHKRYAIIPLSYILSYNFCKHSDVLTWEHFLWITCLLWGRPWFSVDFPNKGRVLQRFHVSLLLAWNSSWKKAPEHNYPMDSIWKFSTIYIPLVTVKLMITIIYLCLTQFSYSALMVNKVFPIHTVQDIFTVDWPYYSSRQVIWP